MNLLSRPAGSPQEAGTIVNHERDEALDALREIHARRSQILATTRPAQLPRSYRITTALAFTAVGISTDLTVPLRPIVQLAALLCLLAAVATLTGGAPARPNRTEVRTSPQAATGVVVLAVGALAGAGAVRAGLPLARITRWIGRRDDLVYVGTAGPSTLHPAGTSCMNPPSCSRTDSTS